MINFGIPYPKRSEECEILEEIIEREAKAKELRDIIDPIREVIQEYNEDTMYEMSLRGEGVIAKESDCESVEKLKKEIDIEEQLIRENKKNNYKLY